MTKLLTAPSVDQLCPLRPGDGCRLCVPGATGPHDCGLVVLVTSDPELRAGLHRAWTRHDAAANSASGTIASS